jgi:hypothetical protein
MASRQGYAPATVDKFWIRAVDNWVGWGKSGGESARGVEGPFPGVHLQLRMILIQQFIFKTSTHLTVTNASPRPQIGPTSHHHPEPVG